MQSIAHVPKSTFLDGRLELCFAQQDGQQQLRGQPAIFIHLDKAVQVFEPITHFLEMRYVRSTSTPSSNSWAKAGYALVSWLRALQLLEVHWTDANYGHLLAYRDVYAQTPSPQTGEPYGAKGIGDAMRVIKNLYSFSERHDLYFGDIHTANINGKDEDSKYTQDYGKSKQTKKDSDEPKANKESKIRPLQVHDLNQLLNASGPRASERNGDMRLCRNRIALDLGWAVGLRVSEIIGLTTLQFLQLSPDPETPMVNMTISVRRGKGRKTRSVLIPTWLVIDVQAYIDEERKDALEKAETKSTRPPTALFLGEVGSNKCGIPIGVDALQKAMRGACLTVGLSHIVVREQSGELHNKLAPSHSIHDLRHTYAVYTYHLERSLGNAEPWKKIQAQLGHDHMQTTIDIYLKHVQLFNGFKGMPLLKNILGY